VAGIDLLVTDKWSVRLSEGVDVDVRRVEEWATRLINGRGREDDLSVSPSCIDALSLLPGWYDDWVLMERERIRQRMLHALEALSCHLVKAGRFADAVDAAILAVNAEPLRESAQRTLIQAHIAEGNLVEARRTYCNFRKLVRTELDVEPSSDLLTLLRDAQIRLSRDTSSAAGPTQFRPTDGLEHWSTTSTRRMTSIETSV
jgi:DNA-binding SARP family transcriptional activator